MACALWPPQICLQTWGTDLRKQDPYLAQLPPYPSPNPAMHGTLTSIPDVLNKKKTVAVARNKRRACAPPAFLPYPSPPNHHIPRFIFTFRLPDSSGQARARLYLARFGHILAQSNRIQDVSPGQIQTDLVQIYRVISCLIRVVWNRLRKHCAPLTCRNAPHRPSISLPLPNLPPNDIFSLNPQCLPADLAPQRNPPKH